MTNSMSSYVMSYHWVEVRSLLPGTEKLDSCGVAECWQRCPGPTFTKGTIWNWTSRLQENQLMESNPATLAV